MGRRRTKHGMDFFEAEELFRHFRDEHRRGLVSGDTFAAEIGKLQVVDAQGRQWMIGARSGNWYYLDENSEWTIGDPHATATMATRCLQCGQPLELGKGLCDDCIAAAVAQTVNDAPETEATMADWSVRRHGDGVVRLALTVLGLVLVCAFLFVFQMTASQWLTPSVLPGPNAPLAVVVTETEVWPPLPLPTPSPSPLVSTVAAPTTIPPDTATATATEAVASSTPSPSPKPTLPAATSVLSLTGRLVFPLFDSSRGTYHLYSANIESGGDRRQLLEQASQPDVNAAGQLAYRSWNDSSRGLLLSSLSGGESTRLVSYSEAARPSWSPDGTELLFYSLQEGDRKARIYRTSTRGDFKVVNQGDATVFGETPAWLMDGRFVNKCCLAGRCGLYIVNPQGGTDPLILDSTATAPEASPDGRWVAFMSQRDGNWDIYVIGVGGGKLARLTHDPANDGLPAWSPDGLHLAFLSDRGNEWAVWVVQPDGSGERQVFALQGTPEGRVRSAQSYESRGWTDERICWIP